MESCKVFVAMLITIMCLGLVSIPNAFSQVNPNVQVLSYSWYVNSAGHFIVVGEVQNDGNSTLMSVNVNATAMDSNGDQLAGNSAMAYANYLDVSQTAPFYIDLGAANYAGTDWGSTVASVSFNVYNTYSTTIQPYQGLSYIVAFNGTLNGSYEVLGVVRNDGNQTANNVRVVGTFFNSGGTVVAVGYAIVNGSLSSGNQTQFTVSEFDSSASLVAKISSYSLMVQTTTPRANGNIGPTASSPLPKIDVYAIAVLAITAIILILIVLLMLRKRSKESSEAPAPPPSPPSAPGSPPPPPPPTEEYKASKYSMLSHVCLKVNRL